MKSRIFYRCGYKYQIAKEYQIQVNIMRGKDAHDISTEFIDLKKDGRLIIKAGYSWDGPSGCTIDTKNFLRGSLVHDCLYQLIRQSQLGMRWRLQADIELKRICREDGMCKLRCWYVYRAVRRFAKFAALPENKKKVLEAP